MPDLSKCAFIDIVGIQSGVKLKASDDILCGNYLPKSCPGTYIFHLAKD